MSARLLNGTEIASRIRDELKPRVAAFTARAGRPPGLGIVLVGSGNMGDQGILDEVRLISVVLANRIEFPVNVNKKNT